MRGWTPTLAPIDLEPPDFLDADARAAWEAVVPILRAAGIATVADRSGLAVCCTLWSTWVQIQRRITADGGVIVVRRGTAQPHPLATSAARLLPLLRLYLAEYGMTPGGRSRIKVDPPRPKSRVDEFRARHDPA